MKVCNTCKTSQSLSEFHKNKNRKDGHSNYCKSCAKTRNKAYYESTPERNEQRRASWKKRREIARKNVWFWLLTHPCVDCGQEDPRVLEFDHVRGTKLDNISSMVQAGVSLKKLKEEIDKCDVRCANCHRIVTFERGGWYSGFELVQRVD